MLFTINFSNDYLLNALSVLAARFCFYPLFTVKYCSAKPDRPMILQDAKSAK